MLNRCVRWLGAALAMIAIVAAALLTGAVTAGADTGSESTAAGEKPDQSSAGDAGAAEAPAPATPSEKTAEKHRSGTAKKKLTAQVHRPVTKRERRSETESEGVDTEPAQRRRTDVAATAGQKPAVTRSTSTAAVEATPPAEAVVTKAATPRRASLMNAVGSAVLNVVMGLIQFFAGPPVLPADAHVTVRTSTLRIPVAGGRTVTADWYFPDADEPATRLIYLQHGFGAVGSMYSDTAAALAERTHSIVVAPTITSNFLTADGAWLAGTPMQQAVADLFAGDRDALTASASAAAGREVVLPRRFTLVGHSAGGSLVMGAAGDMIDGGAIADLAGIVLLDSVDMNGSVPIALSKLTGVNDRPVMDISSERYVWNMFGAVGDELDAARPGRFNGVMLTGGRHIDAMDGGNPVIQFAEYVVAGFSAPRNVDAVKSIAAGWVNDLFAGTSDGYYPEPRRSVDIPTPAGTATAVALPFTSNKHVQGTPWDKVSELILDWIARVALYDPIVGSVAALDV